jgi:hypothetical protein
MVAGSAVLPNGEKMKSRTSQILILILSLFLASSVSGQTSSLSGEVVFSRRVYNEHLDMIAISRTEQPLATLVVCIIQV